MGFTPSSVRQMIALRKRARSDEAFRQSAAIAVSQNPEMLQQLKDAPELLIELLMPVVDKKKVTRPFVLNEVQRDFIRRLTEAKKQYQKGEIDQISILVLKGRQQGFTTLITAYQLASAILSQNFEGLTVADTVENVASIFEAKAKFPYSMLPDIVKPTEKFNNRRELRFDRINSSWAVQVASNQMGRSRTINFLHASECAFWQCGIAATQAGLGEALTADCVRIYESTANGFNDYKEMWDSNRNINLFYEWWRSEEYRDRCRRDELQRLERIIGQGEWIGERLRWLREKGLDNGQLLWYLHRYDGYIDKSLIRQEYPCTAEEAFVSSGRPVFNTDRLTQRIATAPQPVRMTSFMPIWKTPEDRDRIENYMEVNGNDIAIYEEAVPYVPYVIGGDTAGDGGDAYTASVRRNDTGVQVATLYMPKLGSDSSPYTDQLYCLGMYYNRALIGIEVNFNLQPVIELQRLRYPRQYVRQNFDSYRHIVEEKYGWKTDGNTRPILYTGYARMINENVELITDKRTLTEAREWEYDDKGRPNHRPSGHDDCLFADMIAYKIREQQSYEVAVPTKKVKVAADVLSDYQRADRQTREIIIKRYGGIPYTEE